MHADAGLGEVKLLLGSPEEARPLIQRACSLLTKCLEETHRLSRRAREAQQQLTQ